MEQLSRRRFISLAGTAIGVAPLYIWIGGPGMVLITMSDSEFPFKKLDEEWQESLSPEQHRILRKHGTEPPFTSSLDQEKRPGTFTCAGCGQPLFQMETKFDSRTGWPSFYQPLDGAVGTSTDRAWFAVRTEVHCSRCGGHLGHVFEDGPPPTGLRYCMNGVAMKFITGST